MSEYTLLIRSRSDLVEAPAASYLGLDGHSKAAQRSPKSNI